MKVTTEDIINAMEKNGYTHIRGQWFSTVRDGNKTIITGACIMGQVALNLGAERSSVLSTLNAVEVTGAHLGNLLMNMNDQWNTPYKDMLKFAKECLKPHKGKVWTMRKQRYNVVKKETD